MNLGIPMGKSKMLCFPFFSLGIETLLKEGFDSKGKSSLLHGPPSSSNNNVDIDDLRQYRDPDLNRVHNWRNQDLRQSPEADMSSSGASSNLSPRWWFLEALVLPNFRQASLKSFDVLSAPWDSFQVLVDECNSTLSLRLLVETNALRTSENLKFDNYSHGGVDSLTQKIVIFLLKIVGNITQLLITNTEVIVFACLINNYISGFPYLLYQY